MSKTGFVRSRVMFSGGFVRTWQQCIFGFHERRSTCWLAVRLLLSHEILLHGASFRDSFVHVVRHRKVSPAVFMFLSGCFTVLCCDMEFLPVVWSPFSCREVDHTVVRALGTSVVKKSSRGLWILELWWEFRSSLRAPVIMTNLSWFSKILCDYNMPRQTCTLDVPG
jgi:hypothetical protein